VRLTTKAALTLAATVSMVAALAGVAAGPASANYRPPSIHLLCTAANGGTLEGSVCVLPPGQTTAPNNYSATIAVGKSGAAGAAVTFALSAGSLPPGLTMPAQGGSGTVITGNPTKAGTYSFTVKATDGGLTATLAYQITITVQGPPDQLLCTAANGSFLESGVCVLPDAVAGLSYQGHLPTSHNAGGTLSIVAGSLPPGLSLPATFGASGDTVGGTDTQPAGTYPYPLSTYTFTVQGTGDLGQPLYQAYVITEDPDQPLTINNGDDIGPGVVGSLYADQFCCVSGGAAPYTWSLVSRQFPPGLSLQTFSNSDPRDVNDTLAGTTTTAGTYTFTMKLSDYDGQHTTQQFTVTVYPPLQITTSTTLPAGTVGVPYSHDLTAQGGNGPPYSWFDDPGPLPPGLSLGSAAPNTGNVLTGTPTQAGTFSFGLLVEDPFFDVATSTVTVTIDP
jgi:Putative Ig domain